MRRCLFPSGSLAALSTGFHCERGCQWQWDRRPEETNDQRKTEWQIQGVGAWSLLHRTALPGRRRWVSQRSPGFPTCRNDLELLILLPLLPSIRLLSWATIPGSTVFLTIVFCYSFSLFRCLLVVFFFFCSKYPFLSWAGWHMPVITWAMEAGKSRIQM